MGWWRIRDVESGGINWSFHKGGLTNATKDNTTTELVNGDTPADIMGDAVDKIVDEYKSYWGRSPTKSEFKAVLNFVLNPLKLAE